MTEAGNHAAGPKNGPPLTGLVCANYYGGVTDQKTMGNMTQQTARFPNVQEGMAAKDVHPGRSPLSIGTNCMWNISSGIVNSLCQWGMLMILAKLCSPGQVGQFTLGFAITAPIFIFSTFQLRTIFVTDTDEKYSFEDYLAVRLISTLLAFFLVCIIAVGFRSAVDTAMVIVLVGLHKAGEALYDIFHGRFQKWERMDRIGISVVCRSFISLAAFGTIVYLTRSVAWGILCLSASSTVVLLGFDCNGGRWGSGCLFSGRMLLPRQLNILILKRLVVTALPLGIVVLLMALIANLPRYVVEHFLGQESLGRFAVVAYIYAAGSGITTGLVQGAIPSLARRFNRGDLAGFVRLMVKLCGVACTFGAIGILAATLAGAQVLTLLYRSEYASERDFFVAMMWAALIAFVATVVSNGVTVVKSFRIQPPLYVIVLVITAISSYMFIPQYGLIGTAITVGAGSAVQLLGSIVLCWRGLQSAKRAAVVCQG